MPALVKSSAVLPRFVPHSKHGVSTGAGSFSNSKSRHTPKAKPAVCRSENSEHLDQLAHDARNVLSGLMLYCELLSAPGVLVKQHGHFAQELESIVRNTAQIIERMAAAQQTAAISEDSQIQTLPAASFVPLPAVRVNDMAEELRRLQPLLAAIAGPAIHLSIATMPCAGHIALAVEDLARILVNLVRNAVDAMPNGGHIRITAQYGDGLNFLDSIDGFVPPCSPSKIILSVVDNGPGIPASVREKIFETGFSTRTDASTSNWPTPRHRGLGLSIVRNLVEAAGGRVEVAPAQTRGARFEICLPITSGTYVIPSNSAFPADSIARGCIECQ
jgi:signal transduction histidine kinase